MRSYDSRALAPKEKMPCFMRTTPTVSGVAARANSRATACARSNPGIRYGMTITALP